MEQMVLFCGAVTNTGVVAVPAAGFDRGMELSRKAAERSWSAEQQDGVDAEIERLAASGRRFTSEDVWKALGDEFPVSKGMAARLLSFARRGMIRNTGELARATRGGAHDHGQRLSVWEGKK